MAVISITRTALYRRVWSEPMRKLAGEFGISDVGLAKVCRKHSIPCPPRGYWAKKSAGQEVVETPLPDAENDSEIEFGDQFDDGSERRSASKAEDGPPVEVRDNLRGAHPLVAEANHQFQIADTDSDGFLIRPEDASLDLRVTKSTLRRGLFIMDALFRALEQRGYAVSQGPTVLVQETPVRFRVVESMDTYEEEPDEPDFSDRYQFSHSRFRKSRRPSGKLAVEIDGAKSYWLRGARSTWRDTATKPLERRLDKVLAGLIEFADRVRRAEHQRQLENAKRKAEEQRRQEAARERALKLQAIEAENERVENLLHEARCWKQSQRLRRFIEAARQWYLQDNATIEPNSEFAEWMAWAGQQADRLDPLKENPPSILDDPVEDEADHDRRHHGHT